jgi:hypothetical protein
MAPWSPVGGGDSRVARRYPTAVGISSSDGHVTTAKAPKQPHTRRSDVRRRWAAQEASVAQRLGVGPLHQQRLDQS